MNNRDSKEKAFTEQLAYEVAQNKDAIAEILHRSRVGQCGGKCKDFQEEELHN
jgi:dsDNA-binding SOS-regulon protein